MNVLRYCGINRNLSRKAGYHQIVEWLSPGESLFCDRPPVKKDLFGRIVRKVLGLGAMSSWHQPSSIKLEILCVKCAWRKRPDIIHCLWLDHDWGYLDLLIPRHIRLVGTVHVDASLMGRVLKPSKRLHRVDAWVLMSETQAQPMIDLGIPRERLHVIHHGINIDQFYPSDRDKTRRDRLKILHVGTHQRNFDCLRSLATVLDKAKFELTVISAPDTHYQFSGIPGVCCLSGLSESQLLDHYHRADCLLQLVNEATANNALLEGMACGLPIISQLVGGVPEYVNEKCSILCNPNDCTEVEDALGILYDDDKLRLDMGRASRQRALELDWVHVAEKTQQLYERVFVGVRH